MKITNWPSYLLIIQFQFLFFWFFFFGLIPPIKVLFVFNFIIEFQFTKYYILQFGPHYLDF
jgi:hypothetical protein